MAKITISNLETAEISLQQLTATELDATKGGIFNNSSVANGSLNDNKVNVLSVDAENVLKNLDEIEVLGALRSI